MDLLLQLVADQTGLGVVRPVSLETTAIGAATLAGLAEGVWGTLDDLADLWTEDDAFAPQAPAIESEAAHQAWLRAVERSRHWADEG
jgi:glycerol kinase